MRNHIVRPLLTLALLAGTVVGLVAASPAAGAVPAFGCGTVTGGSNSVHSHVTNVRVGRHASFDRFVVQFSTSKLPHYSITPKASAKFILDPSGKSVQLRGHAGIKVVMHSATGQGTYTGPSDFKTGFPQLREARRIGDFEGYLSWGLGLAHQSCKRVFTLKRPSRLVIDVPH